MVINCNEVKFANVYYTTEQIEFIFSPLPYYKLLGQTYKHDIEIVREF